MHISEIRFENINLSKVDLASQCTKLKMPQKSVQEVKNRFLNKLTIFYYIWIFFIISTQKLYAQNIEINIEEIFTPEVFIFYRKSIIEKLIYSSLNAENFLNSWNNIFTKIGEKEKSEQINKSVIIILNMTKEIFVDFFIDKEHIDNIKNLQRNDIFICMYSLEIPDNNSFVDQSNIDLSQEKWQIESKINLFHENLLFSFESAIEKFIPSCLLIDLTDEEILIFKSHEKYIREKLSKLGKEIIELSIRIISEDITNYKINNTIIDLIYSIIRNSFNYEYDFSEIFTSIENEQNAKLLKFIENEETKIFEFPNIKYAMVDFTINSYFNCYLSIVKKIFEIIQNIPSFSNHENYLIVINNFIDLSKLLIKKLETSTMELFSHRLDKNGVKQEKISNIIEFIIRPLIKERKESLYLQRNIDEEEINFINYLFNHIFLVELHEDQTIKDGKILLYYYFSDLIILKFFCFYNNVANDYVNSAYQQFILDVQNIFYKRKQ